MVNSQIRCARCNKVLLDVEASNNYFHIGQHICSDRINYLLSKYRDLVFFDFGNDMKLLDFNDLSFEKDSWCYRIKGFDPTYIRADSIIEIRTRRILNCVDSFDFWSNIENPKEEIASIFGLIMKTLKKKICGLFGFLCRNLIKSAEVK